MGVQPDFPVEAVRVEVLGTKGSAPREAGAFMLVWADGQSGTIGGGVLEWNAAKRAREMLAGGAAADAQSVALGPEIGQCCGGCVELGFARVREMRVSQTKAKSQLAQGFERDLQGWRTDMPV